MRTLGRLTVAAVTAGAVLAFVAACSDRSSPTSPEVNHDAQGRVVMGVCTTIAKLDTMAANVFGAGSANLLTVRTKLQSLSDYVAVYDVEHAQAKAREITDFVKQKVTAGGLPGSESQINEFISGASCYAGLTPDTWLVVPSSVPQIHTTDDGNSGIYIEPGTVTTPTIVTITPIDSSEASPLDTKLDQYPTLVRITSSAPLSKPVTIALCPTVEVPAAVRGRLRVGHQATQGFEITPKADGGFLTCENSIAMSRTPKFLRALARLVLPKVVYAASFEVSGIGGSATEFSPFGVVDPEVSFSGGVGGSATEFIRAPGSLVSGGVCVQVSATVATQLEPECRPSITLTTPNGTTLTSVPISWAVSAGGGTIAATVIATQNCGAFSNTAPTITNAQGKAGVCWVLGALSGANTVIATPSAGGDVPPGTIFNPPSMQFSATGLALTPEAVAVGGTFVFDNAPHAGNGSCSNGLVPDLSYSSGTAPVAIGDHTLTVTCGADNGAFTPMVASATISILAVAPSVSITCPATVTFNGAPWMPCTATASAPGLVVSPTVTYGNNTNAGTALASVALPAGGNYSGVTTSKEFTIARAATATTLTCTGGPFVYTGAQLKPCVAKTTSTTGFTVVPSVTYSSNVNVGTASAGTEFDGNVNYNGSTAATTFPIVKATATATAGNATIKLGDPVPAIPCVVTGLAASDGSAVTCTTTVPAVSAIGTYTTTPVVTPGNPANYTVTPVSGALSVSTIVAQAGAIGGTFTFDNAPHAGSATCSNSLTPTLSYSSTTPPVAVGVHTLTVTCGAGNAAFTPGTATATITIVAATPTVSITCPASVPYAASPRTPCTATATAPGLSISPAVAYANNVNAGTAIASVTLAATGNYGATSASDDFAITKANATATSASATMTFGNAVPSIACSVSGLVAGDAGAVTCTSSVPAFSAAGTYTVTPVISPSNPTNYNVASVTGTLTVNAPVVVTPGPYHQDDCFQSPLDDGWWNNFSWWSNNYVQKGSVIPVKCKLETHHDGPPVTTARGNIAVYDYGSGGFTGPTLVFSGTNVFTQSSPGRYVYNLDTSSLIAWHYYSVVATWDDGSHTTGWFRLKQ